MPTREPRNGKIAVESYKHQDTRANIPTEELRSFMAGDEDTPAQMLYPRDPSLDPQLVWRGKDDQDRRDLGVSVVPIYIQEKIHPQAIINQIRANAASSSARHAATGSPALFADFNGIGFEQLVDFYHNQQHWTNRMILGDSLLVMSSLAEKEGLKGRVQMIYMDPPYGIKFGSNWQVSTRKRDVKDGKADDLTRQPEQIKAFRDTWELGIHSYLTYLRDRLTAARELLTESGSIFVQIGDENVHLVRCLLDEVFGSENLVSQVTLWKTSGATSDTLPTVSDYLIWYAKNAQAVKYRQLYQPKQAGQDAGGEYKYLELPDGSVRPLSREETLGSISTPLGSRPFRPSPMTSQSASATTTVAFEFQGIRYLPGSGGWKTNSKGFTTLTRAGRILRRDKSLSYIRYLDDFPVVPISNLWLDTRWGFDAAERIYVVQTNVKAVQRCILMTTDPGDLVLDPTCGSGTTAYVAEQWGRRWITVDTSRVALALARTRLMSARFPYYLLKDSPEGVKKEAELTGQWAPDYKTEGDIRQGFVYKRVPHVTLKSIAKNAEIDTIAAKWQPQLDDARRELNKQLGESWEEWQIPREADPAWHPGAKVIHADYWILRRQRQQEIDASIARNAETELLYDQPYEDPKRVRVAGPFTVESLSPHRVLAPEQERPAAERDAQRDDTSADFPTLILENLKKAGVQNTVAGERLVFDRLEPVAGEWIQFRGDYTSKADQTKRVAVSLGPQYGTVGAEQVQKAAMEARKGIAPADVLLVCGFAFDAPAGETARELSPSSRPLQKGIIAESSHKWGALQVLLAKMNPDLAMGDELLKKTGAGNLFMVFGEPDIHIQRQDDGRLAVTLRGLDIYDPTTGEVRSSSTDEIACWFLDTNYNEQSFCVRHAYFTGNGDTYDRLKRALRAEIDEAAWSALYSAESLPFDPPATGKFAIKVINHYGDEVLKVYTMR